MIDNEIIVQGCPQNNSKSGVSHPNGIRTFHRTFSPTELTMSCRLKDKVAMVTGAGSGIGRATALAYAREGAKVVVADINSPSAQETVNRIQGAGGAAIGVRCDVTNAQDVRALIDHTLDAFGRLDCAYNNAGIEGPMFSIDAYDEDAFDQVIAVNLKGIWLCMKHEVRAMLQSGRGVVVNAGSVVSTLGQPKMAAYVASKHAVLGLTRSAALEYADRGLRFNAVCPAIVATPMLDRFTGGDEKIAQSLTINYPIKRILRAEEVAEAVVWLSSDATSYLNGHALMLDGGFSIQ